jgi:hypothetical protein
MQFWSLHQGYEALGKINRQPKTKPKKPEPKSKELEPKNSVPDIEDPK